MALAADCARLHSPAGAGEELGEAGVPAFYVAQRVYKFTHRVSIQASTVPQPRTRLTGAEPGLFELSGPLEPTEPALKKGTGSGRPSQTAALTPTDRASPSLTVTHHPCQKQPA